jgi:hypothetical protein
VISVGRGKQTSQVLARRAELRESTTRGALQAAALQSLSTPGRLHLGEPGRARGFALHTEADPSARAARAAAVTTTRPEARHALPPGASAARSARSRAQREQARSVAELSCFATSPRFSSRRRPGNEAPAKGVPGDGAKRIAARHLTKTRDEGPCLGSRWDVLTTCGVHFLRSPSRKGTR